MIRKMSNVVKGIGYILGVFCLYQSECVYAYVPIITTHESLEHIELIQESTIVQVFFGELKGMPHTYEVVLEKPLTLSLELRTPETPSSTNSISSIVIKVPKKGRVEEITRLLGKTAVWESKRDEMTYDRYLKGATYTGDLEPGTYRIEVHTPDNNEKYMLRVGTEETMTVGYFALLRRLGGVKEFYGTSRFWLIATPYVYIPLFVCGAIVSVWWGLRRRIRMKTEE